MVKTISAITIAAVAVVVNAQDQQTVAISASVVEYVTVAKDKNNFCLSGKNAELYHVFALGAKLSDKRQAELFNLVQKTTPNCHRLVQSKLPLSREPQWIMISPE